MQFTKRLAEQVVIAGAAAFFAALEASGGQWDRAGIALGLGAVGRVVYALLVKPAGDKDSPNAVK
ncbi:hypothetical protein [Streptomyces sp. SID3212]|uniref:hypothetical protein n=1 Tax=Streptomyces sp. SID3212 TaxID=2690259 RepID=UPI00136E2431|nr:hypothetical protein [Streptomyces sp. SID3212]MYV58050.1 hypothetical protein [Streptomyces sp. SID3212]